MGSAGDGAVSVDERTTLYLKTYRERFGTLPARLTEYREAKP